MIDIDFKSRKPIYEQIIDEIKEQVLTGKLKPDEQLPSIRQLTSILGVNPNTLQKSFNELERQNVIYSLAGRGNFVSSDIGELIKSKASEIKKETHTIAVEAKKVGIDKADIIQIVENVYENNEKYTL